MTARHMHVSSNKSGPTQEVSRKGSVISQRADRASQTHRSDFGVIMHNREYKMESKKKKKVSQLSMSGRQGVVASRHGADIDK